jgi:hypothetical protein
VRSPAKRGRELVAGPNIYICDRCATEAAHELARTNGGGEASGACAVGAASAAAPLPVAVASSPGTRANVCDAYLKLCQEFMQLDA